MCGCNKGRVSSPLTSPAPDPKTIVSALNQHRAKMNAQAAPVESTGLTTGDIVAIVICAVAFVLFSIGATLYIYNVRRNPQYYFKHQPAITHGA